MCLFDRLLFLVLVFVLFAAFVSHCVPPLVLLSREPVSLTMNATKNMNRSLAASGSAIGDQGQGWKGDRPSEDNSRVSKPKTGVRNRGAHKEENLRERDSLSADFSIPRFS